MASAESGEGISSTELTEPNDEALAQEFQLGFSNLGPVERGILLCWRKAGLRPYDDDPPGPTEVSSESEGTDGDSQLTVADDTPAAVPCRRQSTDW